MLRRNCFLLLTLAVIALNFSYVFAASDISGHWAKSYIDDWTEKGFVKSYTDGTFKPDKNITRAEFMTLVNNAFGYYEMGDISFSDVKKSDWFYNAVSVAHSAGYINGYTDNTMKPNKTITREEVAVILTNLLGVQLDPSMAESFSDSKSLSWSKPYVGASVAAGILKGYSTDNTFKPQKNMTRAEAVVALSQTLNKKNGNTGNNNNNNDLPQDDNNDDNVSTADLIISTSTYGPDSGIERLSGTAEITNKSKTEVKNMNISQDLIINRSASSRITLDNVTVSGTLYINSSTSLSLLDCNVKRIVVEKDAGKPELTVEGMTDIELTYLNCSAKLTEYSLGTTYNGFRKVYIEKSTAEAERINLKGKFELLEVQAYKVNIYLDSGTIEDLFINADATKTSVILDKDTIINSAELRGEQSKIIGEGKLKKADIRADGIVLERAPDVLIGTKTPTYEDSTERYDVSITVTDSSGRKIQDAQVTLSGISGTKNTNSDGQVLFTGVPVKTSNYVCTVTKTGYAKITDEFVVSTKNIDKSYKLTDGYTISFIVSDNTNNLISGAAVNFNGYTVNTDSKGRAEFLNVGTGNQSYTVSKSGYSNVNYSVNVSRSTSESITLVPIIPSTNYAFTVIDSSTRLNIDGAQIILLQGSSQKGSGTTSGGTFTFKNFANGSYTYKVSKTGYADITGQVTMNGGDSSITVNLAQNVVQKKYKLTISFTPDSSDIMLTDLDSGKNTSMIKQNNSCTFDVEVGKKYQYTVTKDGYNSETKIVTISNEQTDVSVDLMKISEE